jgi:uncharacterized Zn-finger protein
MQSLSSSSLTMYQFQPQVTNSDYHNDQLLEYPLIKEDFGFYTTEDLLLTSGYYLSPSIASPSSHYSNESYFSPVEQAANLDFRPVPQCDYDYWSSYSTQASSPLYPSHQSYSSTSNQASSSPMYPSHQSCYTVNQTYTVSQDYIVNQPYNTENQLYNSSYDSIPLSSSSTSQCSTISSYSVEEKQTITEGKHYACPTCRRAFARKHDLQRHIRVHTGEKPYACPCCNKAFARTDALKRHLRMEEQCRNSHQVQTMKDTGKRRYRNL